jgi:molybdate/tungstate transport system permease protein
VIPHSVAGIVVLFGFGSDAVFPGLRVLNGVAGMVLAMTFVSAPYAVDAARGAFDAVDRSLVRAARSHGAGPAEAFRRVTLPLSARGILTGGVLAWARAVSEFGAVAVVAYSVSIAVPTAELPPAFETATTQHAPVYIYNTYVSQGLPESAAVATLLLAVSALLFLLVRWVAYEGRGGVLS